MTPAALTARVKAFEDAVDLKLFDRTSTGMRLTKAGEAALEASRAVERAVRDFTDAMLAISTGDRRLDCRLGPYQPRNISPRGSLRLLSPSRPKVDLRFQIGNRDATVNSLRNGEIEIALAGRAAPRDGGRGICLRPASLRADRSAGASFGSSTEIASSRSCRGGVPVPGDRLRHAIAVRRLYRRHEHQAGSNAHGAGVERDHQAGCDGGNRNRAHFGPHHRCGGCRRKAGMPRRQRPTDPSPLVCGQPDRQGAFAGRKRVSRFRRKPGVKVFASHPASVSTVYPTPQNRRTSRKLPQVGRIYKAGPGPWTDRYLRLPTVCRVVLARRRRTAHLGRQADERPADLRAPRPCFRSWRHPFV